MLIVLPEQLFEFLPAYRAVTAGVIPVSPPAKTGTHAHRPFRRPAAAPRRS
jgi:hypothetical protein